MAVRSKFIYLICKLPVLFLIVVIQLFQSCHSHKKVYQSDCNDEAPFKRINFAQLIDSMAYYDKQYIEIRGTYKEAKLQSALFNDSLFVDHSKAHAIWINFSQDCPLYLLGTRSGLFTANDGQFTSLDNKKVIIRGIVDARNKGHKAQYSGCIDRISFIEL